MSNDTEKKFTWAEASYIHKFWNDDKVDQISKTNLTNLINEGRFEIVGGGWVMHDEVLTDYNMQLLNI